MTPRHAQAGLTLVMSLIMLIVLNVFPKGVMAVRGGARV